MTQRERKKLKKQLRYETFYRENILPQGELWAKDVLTDNFKYLTTDFIREMRDYIDFRDAYWYVITDDELDREFGELCSDGEE